MSTITTSSSSKTAELDAPLHAIGFELDVLSPNEVTGTLKITETCCQPFGVLHGGISALIAEALGSIGAHLVAGPGVHRIAGIQLSIYHHSSAKLGDVVYARATPVRATPVRAGKTIQAITIKEYPSELSLATWICIMGATEGTVVALVMECGQLAAWSIGWNSKLLAIVFSGVVCSGMAYCFQGATMKEKGPVFVTSFSPLSMILVAACGMLLLGEDLFLGGAIGSVLIVLGLYMVVRGKSRDPQPEKKDKAVELAIDA